ncbi:MAG: CvpA family protein [Rubrivivax sp.]|nr:CvpA family protein [Rubrivivax sp.]
MPELPWIDWALLAVLIVSVIVGLVRGFVFEVMSLVGWIVAWFGAQWLVADVAPYIPLGEPDSGARRVAAYVAAFVGILLVWAIGARLVRLLIHATPLSVPDRLLGAGFGLLRGAVLLLAVATLVMLTPAAQSKPWQRSEGARWLGIAMIGLKPLLPADWARHLPEPGS